MFSSSSLYSWNSEKSRNMKPICETDFESRLCFNSSTINRQKSIEEAMVKEDFVVDYERYKFVKRKEKQNRKIAKSLKSCYQEEDANDEPFEKNSLRSNYGSHLIRSDASVNGYEQDSRSLQNAVKCYSGLSINSNNTCNRLTVNGNHQSSGNFLNVDYLSLRDMQHDKNNSSYSLASTANRNDRLCNLTADYKANNTSNYKLENTANLINRNYGTSASNLSNYGYGTKNDAGQDRSKNDIVMTSFNERKQSKSSFSYHIN